jgi:hypothetical protein
MRIQEKVRWRQWKLKIVDVREIPNEDSKYTLQNWKLVLSRVEPDTLWFWRSLGEVCFLIVTTLFWLPQHFPFEHILWRDRLPLTQIRNKLLLLLTSVYNYVAERCRSLQFLIYVISNEVLGCCSLQGFHHSDFQWRCHELQLRVFRCTILWSCVVTATGPSALCISLVNVIKLYKGNIKARKFDYENIARTQQAVRETYVAHI